MKVKYLKHNEEMPDLGFEKGYGNSVAIDLYTVEDVQIKAFEFKKIPLGISVALPKGYKADIRMRSSTFEKFGIIQTNAVGLVDSTYVGEGDIWTLPVYKLPIRIHLDNEIDSITVIPKGTRLCQMEIVKSMEDIVMIPCTKEEYLEEVGENNRGGFGSTGV